MSVQITYDSQNGEMNKKEGCPAVPEMSLLGIFLPVVDKHSDQINRHCNK